MEIGGREMAISDFAAGGDIPYDTVGMSRMGNLWQKIKTPAALNRRLDQQTRSKIQQADNQS